MPIFNFATIFLSAATVSLTLSFAVTRLAQAINAVDRPDEPRKKHSAPIPALGGLGIGCTILIGLRACWSLGWLTHDRLQPRQLLGFAVGLFILMCGGAWDDRVRLSPWKLVWFPALAAVAVIFGGTTIQAVTRIGSLQPYSLIWSRLPLAFAGWHWVFSWPADVLTFVWLLAVTAATKFADGLDGLVAGQTLIGAGVIAALALSSAYAQPAVAVFAVIVAGAFAGFLPRNVFPARQFLGESGSTLAGFSLGFLAIVSGAKVATALMAIGLPLVDIVFVMFGRVWRGQHPFRGDRTHLHFRMLRLGLGVRETVWLFWTISLVFGVAALAVQTRGKLVLLLLLLALAMALSTLAARRSENGNEE